MRRSLLPALVVLFVLGATTAGAITARADSGGHGNGSKEKCSQSSKASSEHHCRKDNDGDSDDSATTSTTGTSTKQTTTAQTTTAQTTTAQTTTSKTSGGQTTCWMKNGVCGLDVEWLTTSMEGDLFEIEGGKLALSKSNLPAVRQLAQTLISDHTQSFQEASDLAKKYGVPVPSEPSPSEQWELEELGEMHGSEFNHDYSELEIKDHEQDIQETTDEVEMGCNAEVRENARQDIPMLQKHLQLSRVAFQAAGPEYPKTSGSTSSSTGSSSNG